MFKESEVIEILADFAEGRSFNEFTEYIRKLKTNAWALKAERRGEREEQEKTAALLKELAEIRVGDEVVIVHNNGYFSVSVGSIGRVTEIHDDSFLISGVGFPEFGGLWFDRSHLAKVIR